MDFKNKLDSYLSAELNLAIVANFLRFNRKYQEFFQICRDCHGQPHFLKAEVLFHYEHGSNYRIADKTFEKLLAEVSDEDFVPYQLPGRIRCDELDKFLVKKKPDLRSSEGKTLMRKIVEEIIPDAGKFVDELADFIHIVPKLPSSENNFISAEPIEISFEQGREEIISYLQQVRRKNTTADLAFYVYRDMESCDWTPFVKAVLERNPVSLRMTESMTIQEAYSWLEKLDGCSIYDGRRLAQPDEVANYGTGDGLEKAFLLANVIRKKKPEHDLQIVVTGDDVSIKSAKQYRFVSAKGLNKQVFISKTGDISAA